MSTRPAIRKLFFNVHMGLSHDGLAKLARDAKVKLDTLEDHDLLMFINKRRDKLKVLGSMGKVVAYLRMPANRPIQVEALSYIPATFGVAGFDYDAACAAMLKRELDFDLTAPKGLTK